MRSPPPAITCLVFFAALHFLSCFFQSEALTIDPYKVLGVDKNANQREIQKAFHKLSLLYHPDKNKSKGAQDKFAQINNAYEILSDEQKRKNYDMYGDEKENPGFEAGHPGGQGGYTRFAGGGPGQSHFTFRPGGESQQGMGGQGGSKSFSFSFGGSGDSSLLGFGLDDLFGSFFGGSARSQSGSKMSPGLRDINSHIYKKEVENKGMTWILLLHIPSSKEIQYFESIVYEVAASLEGALKVGRINCEKEVSLCKEIGGGGVHQGRSPRIFVLSYNKENEKGSLVEYMGHLGVKDLKTFCHQHLPRLSKRTDLSRLHQFGTTGKLPRLLLLSAKKDTPVIWRVLSGLYHKRFTFGDVEADDVSDPRVKKLGVEALSAIVGWLPNGEKRILKSGISVKDLKSGIHDISNILNSFEKASRKEQTSSKIEQTIPLLDHSNFETLCGDTTPVCIMGVFRSLKARAKLESVLCLVSDKSLWRVGNDSKRRSVSYALLDAAKQQAFLNPFDKKGFKISEWVLIAYKPRRGKYSVFLGDLTGAEVENFIGSVLSGDIPFREAHGKPLLK